MSIDKLRIAFGPFGAMADDRLNLEATLDEIFRPKLPLNLPLLPPDLHLGEGDGAPITQILAEVREKVIGAAIHTRHPLALAHMCPPPATISVIADLLIGAMNQCAFIWEEAPLAAAVESECIRWMADRIGLGEGATGLLTSGGTLSNLMATHLALAHGVSRDVPDRTRCCIIASDQAHLSIDKAAALSGLGQGSVVRIPTGTDGRLTPGQVRTEALRAAAAGKVPVLFICTAGTTNGGTLEPVEEFLVTARAFRAWCHVDAAYGGMLALRTTRPSAVANWSEADSISWDPHKALYVSYSVGALLVNDRSVLAPLAFSSDYALRGDTGRDAGAFHFEGSRRFEALKLWMTIRHFGRSGFADLVDHSLQLARELARLIRFSRDFELVTEPDTGIVCFRYLGSDLGEPSLDKINLDVQRALFQSGIALLSSTRIGGHVVLRAVLQNPFVDSKNLTEILDLVRAEAMARLQIKDIGRREEANENLARYESAF